MRKRGFTLLEILVVIIIIGILATLALPQYMKTTKKARAAEAISNIGSIRGAELRYYQENDVLSSDLSKLDVENPATLTRSYFDYTVSGDSPSNLTITATGKGIMSNVTITYTATDGKIVTSGL